MKAFKRAYQAIEQYPSLPLERALVYGRRVHDLVNKHNMQVEQFKEKDFYELCMGLLLMTAYKAVYRKARKGELTYALFVELMPSEKDIEELNNEVERHIQMDELGHFDADLWFNPMNHIVF